MNPVMLVGISVAVPFACLALLLILAWLEETLPADVRKAERRAAPEPILAMPVNEPTKGVEPVKPPLRKPVDRRATARPVTT